MERQYATFLIAGLLILLFAAVAGYIMVTSRALGRESQKQRENQVERERLAEKRMADNGGRALSARPADPDGPPGHADRSSQTSNAPYAEGHRRPGVPAGSKGWQ